MKRYNTVLLFFIALFSLCGCSYYIKEVPESSLSPAPSDQTLEGTEPSGMPTQEAILETEAERIEREARVYLAGLSKLFLSEDDIQQDQSGRLAVTDSGCYLRIDRGGYSREHIGYFDYATGRIIPWCNRPECQHVGTDCISYRPLTSYFDKLFYQEGRLYLIAKDEYGAYLESWKADGSDYRRLGTLWDKDRGFMDQVLGTPVYANADKDYLYYFFTEDYENYLIKRMALESGGEPELLATINPKGEKYGLLRLYLFEGELYITATADWGTEIFWYSDTTGEIETVLELEGELLDQVKIFIREGFLYYFQYYGNNGCEIVKRNMDSGESETLLLLQSYYEQNGEKRGYSYDFWSDGSYLYAKPNTVGESNEAIIYVIDFEGNKIENLTFFAENTKNVYDTGNYLLMYSYVNPVTGVRDTVSREQTLYRYDKRQLGTDYAWWEEME